MIKNGNRKSMIRIIHTAKNALGWDDQTYRSFMLHTTGHTSCIQMTAQELNTAVLAIRRSGFVPRKDKDPWQHIPQLRMIRSGWLNLYALGAVTDSRDTAIMAYLKRMTGWPPKEVPPLKPSEVDEYTTCQLSNVIEALKSWNQREEQRLGIADSWVHGG